ncbi:TPA: hypothetical protein HA231_02525 [Candidatus Woesearchaeota archaeon]|nr:hypothetical protein [Candidatus Woesearchaeota archaeon]
MPEHAEIARSPSSAAMEEVRKAEREAGRILEEAKKNAAAILAEARENAASLQREKEGDFSMKKAELLGRGKEKVAALKEKSLEQGRERIAAFVKASNKGQDGAVALVLEAFEREISPS